MTPWRRKPRQPPKAALTASTAATCAGVQGGPRVLARAATRGPRRRGDRGSAAPLRSSRSRARRAGEGVETEAPVAYLQRVGVSPSGSSPGSSPGCAPCIIGEPRQHHAGRPRGHGRLGWRITASPGGSRAAVARRRPRPCAAAAATTPPRRAARTKSSGSQAQRARASSPSPRSGTSSRISSTSRILRPALGAPARTPRRRAARAANGPHARARRRLTPGGQPVGQQRAERTGSATSTSVSPRSAR